MAEAVRKGWIAAQALLLLLPASALAAFILILSYPSYPPRYVSPAQLAFDLGLILTIGGLAAAWRLAWRYWRAGRPGLQRTHGGWLALLALAALIGLAGAATTLVHLLDPVDPGVSVGFALLAPGALLAPLAVQLGIERLR